MEIFMQSSRHRKIHEYEFSLGKFNSGALFKAFSLSFNPFENLMKFLTFMSLTKSFHI